MSRAIRPIGFTIAETFVEKLSTPGRTNRGEHRDRSLGPTTMHGQFPSLLAAAGVLDGIAKRLEGRHALQRFTVGDVPGGVLSFVQYETRDAYRRISVEPMWPMDSLL